MPFEINKHKLTVMDENTLLETLLPKQDILVTEGRQEKKKKKRSLKVMARECISANTSFEVIWCVPFISHRKYSKY